MSSNRRWYTLTGGFGAGILSPASQDDIKREQFLTGAAALRNVRILRDGGLAGRERFVRSNVSVPLPTHGYLGDGTSWEAEADGTTVVRQDAQRTGTRGAFTDAVYDAGGTGIAEWFRELQITDVDVDRDVLKVKLPPFGARPTSFTFHGVRLVEGRWSGRDAGLTRLNFEVRAKTHGMEPLPVLPPVAEDADEDFAGHGAFAPGQVRRDITVPLNVREELRNVDITEITLRVKRANAGTPIRLAIDGFSCFGTSGTAPLHTSVLRGAVRLIPWEIRDVPFFLVLGMDETRWLQLRPELRPRARYDGFHFTRRQLRELTWARFGGSVLLAHRDFVHPLEVSLGDISDDGVVSDFNIRPLALQNVPIIPQETFTRILPDVSFVGEEVRFSDARTDTGGVALLPPGQLLLDNGPGGDILARWPPVGGNVRYQLIYSTLEVAVAATGRLAEDFD